MSPVVDTCMLDDELDMLELRLRTMDWVKVHVIAEADTDHHGRPKPLHFEENRERFYPWLDRIVHIGIRDLPGNTPWERLRAQHDMMLQHALAPMGIPGDWGVLIADVDEILPAEAQAEWDRTTGSLLGFWPAIHMYAVDWLYPYTHEGSPEPRIVQRDSLQVSMTAARDYRGPMPAVDMGWHFTWLGGVEAQTRKLDKIAHTEVTPAQREIITSGAAYQYGSHIAGMQLTPVEVNGSYPSWISKRECPASWFRPRSGDEK